MHYHGLSCSRRVMQRELQPEGTREGHFKQIRQIWNVWSNVFNMFSIFLTAPLLRFRAAILIGSSHATSQNKNWALHGVTYNIRLFLANARLKCTWFSLLMTAYDHPYDFRRFLTTWLGLNDLQTLAVGRVDIPATGQHRQRIGECIGQ